MRTISKIFLARFSYSKLSKINSISLPDYSIFKYDNLLEGYEIGDKDFLSREGKGFQKDLGSSDEEPLKIEMQRAC